MHHYPFHSSDYLQDTVHLGPMEDLTYRRLLDLYYRSETPIPLETQSVATRIRMGSESVSKVLNEFFEQREDGWHQGRCDAEIANYHARAERARNNGKGGGRPKKRGKKPSGLRVGLQNKPRANPDETGLVANQNQEPEPNVPLIPQGEMQEVGGWFGRRPSTQWSEKELKAWKAIQPIDQEDLAALRWYYTKSECKYLRRDLCTLLNNWAAEIDRAKNFNPEDNRR